MKDIQASSPSKLPEYIQKKIESARKKTKKIIFVTGVFDVIHQEHRIFLKKARKFGDILIVGLESDQRVREIKGAGRPTNNQKQRFENLLKIDIVDEVFILPDSFGDTKQHLELIKVIKPHILAVSSHTSHLDKKRSIMEKVGGELKIVHQHNPSVSTTKIINGKVK